MFYSQLITDTSIDQDRLFSIPIIQRALTGDVHLLEYQNFLAQAYHHVKHTVPLLMACGSRLPDRLGWLRDAVAEYIEEELGHEEWILEDIAATGGQADLVRKQKPLPATELMVAYAYDTIHRGNPAGFFGMVHVLEGTSVSLAQHAADAIQKSLNLPSSAFHYLVSHGSVDQEHIHFLASLMNRLDEPGDQSAVLHGAKMFFALYGDIFRSITSNK
ncbi:MAG TPA: iron-containing redox enzyme family protein [Halothiobacillus sp.]|nr:iron-containing redox enzyme family protein [Halothiobacillus sp.]